MATATCQKEKTGNSPPVHWGLILNRVHLSVCHSASSFLQLGSPHMMQWSAIFPNETVSEQQSALFVKKLLAVAISNITYLRAIFPEHAFGDRCLEDLNLKILRDDSTCPGACQVIKWVKGCFDALDKKYLKVLIIGLYQDPDDPNTVIESYTFKFSYTKEGGIDIYRNDKKISSAYTESETKKATIRLLRTVVVLTQTLQSLPDDVMMTMKLLYYEDVTPPDYEPPGFRSAETDQDFKFEEEPLNIKVGDVSTPFHTIKMRIKTSGEQFDLKESTIEEEDHIEKRTETDQQMEIGEETKDAEIYDFHDEQNMSAEPIKSKFKVNRNASSDAAIPSESPAVPGSNDKAVDTTGSQNSQLSETQEDMGVRCPCGCNEDDGLMILCAVCKFWQHGLCFLIMSEDEAPEIHICDMCCDENDPDKQSTDPYLCGLSSVALQATCMWRRALMAASEIDRIVAPNLAKRLGVEMSVAQGLINRLEREGFIQNPQKGKRLGKLVQKEKIMTEGIQKYLSKNKGENMETMEKENVIDENDAKKKTSVSDGQIENLTKMTDNMELSKKKKRKRKSALEKLNEENEIRHSPRIAKMESKKVEPQKSGNKVLSRKRVISKVDEDTEFQLADSQDLTYDSEPDKRRRKASVVARAIRV